MITKLVLNNFKKHEYLVINLSDGLIALQGANEAGKSTCYHAIMYAFFGSRALPLSLAETVTYDKPESSLKVELEFMHDNVAYKIVRSKSGAVLTTAGATANGQAEVTKFVEKLFKVNADVASKLMVASQNGLRGALETNEAVSLIEKLSNLDLIDTLITKVQEQLPCGSTKLLNAAIEELDQLKAPVSNFGELEQEVASASVALATAKAEVKSAKAAVDAVDTTWAMDILAAEVIRIKNLKDANDDLLETKLVLAKPPKVFATDIDALRQKAVEQEDQDNRWDAYELFRKHVNATEFVSDAEPLDVALERHRALEEKLSNQVQDWNLQKIKAQSLRINDDQCSLCGKLLQDVPEVVSKNADADAKVLQFQDLIDTAQLVRVQNSEEWQKLIKAEAADRKAKLLHAKISKYTTISDTVPATLAWVGEVPTALDWVDYAELVKQAEAKKAAAIKDQALRESLQAKLQGLTEKVEKLSIGIDTKIAEDSIREARATTSRFEAANKAETQAQFSVNAAEHQLEMAQVRYNALVEQYEAALANKAKLEADLAAYAKNNALIKKLREARPIVASRLWAIVLASVSTYFSQIRGTPTVVTRDGDRFLADGKPVAGLSGSTLDSLGLAMRMALSKTFLPSIRFLLLDEPASGMDDEREAAMLGLLAASGFEQVLVVTHSELAVSFATNVVQL